MELKVVAVISVIFTITGCRGQTRPSEADSDPRPKTAFGYPVDRAYRVDNRGPQRFAPVTEESSREQQYFNEDSQQDSEQQAQQPLFTPQQQQASLQQYYQQQQLQQQQLQQHQLQQQAALQQYYQNFQQQSQQQNQQQEQQPLPVQVPVPYRPQGQQLRPSGKQPLQQQRDVTDPLTSSVSLLGVRYSAAPAVAHTMFRTNTGVSFSY